MKPRKRIARGTVAKQDGVRDAIGCLAEHLALTLDPPDGAPADYIDNDQ